MVLRFFQLRCLSPCAAAMFFLWCVGQVARDRFWITGLCFYIPSLLAFLGLVILAVWHFKERSRVHSIIGLAISLAAALTGYVAFFVDNAPLRSPALGNGSFTLVHWNAFSGRINWPGGQQDILRHSPDIVVLSEPEYPGNESLRDAMGDQCSSIWFGSMAVAARGEITNVESLIENHDIEVHSFHWKVDGQTIHVFGVDLASDFSFHRDPAIRQVNELIAAHQPDIIVGDFNSPRRSLGLQDLPAGYTHAYDTHGGRFGYTWPVPIPLYALDQCIVSSRLNLASYQLSTSWSDHRMQTIQFSIANQD